MESLAGWREGLEPKAPPAEGERGCKSFYRIAKFNAFRQSFFGCTLAAFLYVCVYACSIFIHECLHQRVLGPAKIARISLQTSAWKEPSIVQKLP